MSLLEYSKSFINNELFLKVMFLSVLLQ